MIKLTLLFSLFIIQPILGMMPPPRKDLVSRTEDLAASSRDLQSNAARLAERMQKEEKEGLMGEWKRGWNDLVRVVTGNKKSSQPMANEPASPLLPPSSPNSRKAQLTRSNDEELFMQAAQERLQEKKRMGDEALLKAKKAQGKSILWGFACLSGFWFSTLSWNSHWCDEKVSVGVGVASGACGINAVRWYLKYRKQDRILEKLTDELLK